MTSQPRTTSSASPSRRTSAPPLTVTAVLVARTREGAGQTLRALLAQDRLPDRVLLVDGALDGLGDSRDLLEPVDEAGVDVLSATLGTHRGIRRDLLALIDNLPVAPVGRDLVWVLTSRSRPHPEALRRLVAASGTTVGMASPTLVDLDDPDRIVRRGLQVTRSGRIVPEPRAGTTNEGQYDHAVDAIAAPLEGLLLDRETVERLGGHDPGLGDFGGDLDLGWRAQRAGRRVVLVPRAAVAVAPTPADRHPTREHRAQARRAALTRAPLLLAPFLALWVAVGSLVGGLALMLLKRPRMGATEIASIPAALDPRRLRSRLRGRAPRVVARSDLSSLFVTRAAARRRLADEGRGRSAADNGAARKGDAASRTAWLGPVLCLVLAASLMSAWAARTITGDLRHRPDAGLVGGELLGGRATGGQLWDAWCLAWHGQGWGHGVEQSPALVVLAGLSSVVGAIPGVGTADSPAGLVLTLLVIVALPLAAVVAWTCAGTFTRRPWVRAAAALAWVTSVPAALAVGEGRIGALLALVLLPRVAAGLVRVGRPGSVFSDAVRTALWGSLLATVAPIVGVLVVLVGLGHLIFGNAARRGRGIILILTPILLAGPWLLTLQANPRRFVAGWGLTDTPADLPAWQLALGQLPGGAATTWWTAAVLVVGVLALLVPGARRASWGAAAVAVLGLLWAVGAPHLVIGHAPPGAADAGTALTPWAGVGQLVLIGGALVAVLLAADVLPDSLRLGGRRSVLALPVLALAVAAIGSGVVVAQHSYGDRLTTWRDVRPLAAVTAAEGDKASRTLVVERTDEGVGYRLVGDEPGDLVRDLPLRHAPVPGEEEVAGAVAQVLGQGEGEREPSEVLAEHGISHLVLVDPTDAQEHVVDGSAGLGRLGSDAGTATWAVRSPVTDGHVPSRGRVATDDSSVPLRGTGAHADTNGPVDAPRGDSLVIAESLDWADRVQVRADGRPLQPGTHSAVPTYDLPAGTDEVSVDVGPGHLVWKVLQGVALVLAVYLAIPMGRRPDPEDEEVPR